MSSSERRMAISIGPAPSSRIAANGNADRVMSDPNTEIVPALQSRTKSRSRQTERRAAVSSVIAPSCRVDRSCARPHRRRRTDHWAVRGRCATLRPPRRARTRAPPGAARDAARPTARSPSHAMFDTLSDRLRKTLANLTGRGRISEADVDAATREIRLALLEADVNFKVVKDVVGRIRERAVGAEILGSLTAGQQIVKIVHDELVELLSAGDRTFRLQGNPAVIAARRPPGLGQDDDRRQARAATSSSSAAGRCSSPPTRTGPPPRTSSRRSARPRHPGPPGARRARRSSTSPAAPSRPPGARRPRHDHPRHRRPADPRRGADGRDRRRRRRPSSRSRRCSSSTR